MMPPDTRRSHRRFRVLVQAVLLASPLALGAATVRIIQTNSAGDNVHLIDPATNKVVAVIDGIEVNHGAAGAPDGSAFYFSNEADHTLDFVDVKTLKVTKKVKLSGRPNNVAISSDGGHVYIAIRQEPGGVDVVDVRSARLTKTVPTGGSVHNPFVTPDGKYVIAGLIEAKKLVVIDGRTEEPAWTMDFDRGVRPIAFEQNTDGSTRRMFVQLSDFHGFAVVDFAQRRRDFGQAEPDVRERPPELARRAVIIHRRILNIRKGTRSEEGENREAEEGFHGACED